MDVLLHASISYFSRRIQSVTSNNAMAYAPNNGGFKRHLYFKEKVTWIKSCHPYQKDQKYVYGGILFVGEGWFP